MRGTPLAGVRMAGRRRMLARCPAVLARGSGPFHRERGGAVRVPAGRWMVRRPGSRGARPRNAAEVSVQDNAGAEGQGGAPVRAAFLLLPLLQR